MKLSNFFVYSFIILFSASVSAQCTDSLAQNYNQTDIINNGSCLYSEQYIDSIQSYYSFYMNQYNSVVGAYSVLSNLYEAANPEVYGRIPLSLGFGWNMIGYNLLVHTDIAAQFEAIVDDIKIVKNNNSFIYWPEFGFNGIGDLVPGQGYQIYMTSSNSFSFEYTDLRLDTNPTIPEWVDEIPILVHPNDRLSLVKIINVFGQDVQLSDVPSGSILLYLYSDGSVVKSFK
jgi:hypothetical protein